MREWQLVNVFVRDDTDVDRSVAIHVRGERIAALTPTAQPGLSAIDGGGGHVIPGLVDHHLHLLSAAARANSVDLSQRSRHELVPLLSEASTRGPVRAVGYDESTNLLSRQDLDAISDEVPIRVQHRGGSLWILNSAALEMIMARSNDRSATLQCDVREAMAGRMWRADELLREPALVAADLDAFGAQLARNGITALTDASVTTDQQQAEAIERLAANMPQRIMLMSGGPLSTTSNCAFDVGPLKIMLDAHQLPTLEQLADRIRVVHDQGRTVAVHCVTPLELALTVAALEITGTVGGDRIEHGSLIPEAMLEVLHSMDLVVVTQPAFIRARGDHYLRECAAGEHTDLYRLASLMRAGIRVAGSSDAPYGPANPWIAIGAAMDRRTAAGALVGDEECLDATQSLNLYLKPHGEPGARPCKLAPGTLADFCVLRAGTTIGEDVDPVCITAVGGRIVYSQLTACTQ